MSDTTFGEDMARSDCWNLYDSYGVTCVHCGCCSPDKNVRYKARVDRITALIEEQEAIDKWNDDPNVRQLQKRNRAITLWRLRQQLRYYRRKAGEYA